MIRFVSVLCTILYVILPQSSYAMNNYYDPAAAAAQAEQARAAHEAAMRHAQTLHRQFVFETEMQQKRAALSQQTEEMQKLAALLDETQKDNNSGVKYNPEFYYPTADLINYGKAYANLQTKQMIVILTANLPWRGPNNRYQAWPNKIANYIKENYQPIEGGRTVSKQWGNGESVSEYYNNFILRMNQNVNPW